MAVTYNSKMEDSLITKIQLFLFNKAFEQNFQINNYFIKENIENIKEDFKEFEITNNLANLYSSKYFQLLENNTITNNGQNKMIKEIVSCLILNKQYMLSKNNIKKYKEIFEPLKEIYKERFEKIFPKRDFENLIEETKCSYCGINISQIQLLGGNGKLNNKRSDTRGYGLEIDRKLPNLEYSKNNCCMTCYWCNNAKTDEYSPKEFKPIAKGINQSWNIKLKKSGQFYKKVVFPEKSKIWNIDFKTKIKEN